MISLKNITECQKCLSGKLFLLLILLPLLSLSQEGMPYRKGKVKHRLSVGGIKSFYQNHPEHTVNIKAKFGFDASYKAELLMGRKANLLIGLEYQNTGLTFNGYFSKPGYTYLFDRTYAYTHDIRIQEVQLPLAIKISFNSEKEHFYSPYFIGGIGARYIFGSYTVISNDSTGVTVFDAKDNIDFENQLLLKGLNAYFQAGLGLQYNIRNSARAFFFEFNYKYDISRIHYDGNDHSNDLNIRDGHLIFSVGFRL
jgi:hypothetical protein